MVYAVLAIALGVDEMVVEVVVERFLWEQQTMEVSEVLRSFDEVNGSWWKCNKLAR